MQVREKPTRNVQKPNQRRLISPTWVAAAVILAATGAAMFTYSRTGSIWKPVPAFKFASLPDYGKGLQIYDRNDKVLATLYADRDTQPVKLADVAPSMRQALLTAEDRAFYRHGGVNLWGVTRAILANLQAGKPVQGGSTITQQLAKNIYFEGETRTIDRKLAEVFLSMELERAYRKDELLESYLNTVYMGHGVYGIERAAQKYFGKSAKALKPSESAFLAALIPAPSVYSQVANRGATIEKQKRILAEMVEVGYLTPDKAKQFQQDKLVFRSIEGGAEKFPHYISYVTSQLESRFGKDMWTHGWSVYTNLDPSAQHLAERTLHNGITKAPRGVSQGALVSISVVDGSVVAMVGGAKEFSKNQWNRAINPHTAGSAFKPFVYLAGLNEGVLKADTMLDDAPLSFKRVGMAKPYSPRNFDGQYLGPITLRKAIALSRNTCAVNVADQVGTEQVIETARLAGITGKMEPNLSLALGSCAVSPLDMANAYATLARGGEYIEPSFVRKVTDKNGRLVFENAPQQKTVFAAEPVAQLVDALQDVVERGTGTRARLFDRPVAGKTGTADGGKDIWFAGFTPDMATVVWGGNDENQPIQGVTGGTVMAGIWQNYMRSYYQAHTIAAGSFVQPVNPLIEEPEPLHFLPTPAGIFGRVVDFFTGGDSNVREDTYENDGVQQAPSALAAMPPVAPDRLQQTSNDDGTADSKKAKKPKKKKGFFKKLVDFFDD